MPQITAPFSGQTVITTFEMTPGTAQDLMDELKKVRRVIDTTARDG